MNCGLMVSPVLSWGPGAAALWLLGMVASRLLQPLVFLSYLYLFTWLSAPVPYGKSSVVAHSCISELERLRWEDQFSCSEGERERVRERGLCGADRVLASLTLCGPSPLRLSSLPSRPPSLLDELLCPAFSPSAACHCIFSVWDPVLVYRSVHGFCPHGRLSRDSPTVQVAACLCLLEASEYSPG